MKAFPLFFLISFLLLFQSVVLGEDWEFRYDSLNKERPQVTKGLIQIDLASRSCLFPRFFNELGITTIQIRFKATECQRKRFSILWSGGSQDLDRFGVKVDGIDVGQSRIVRSEQRPYAWYRDVFFARLGKGSEHVLEIYSLEAYKSAINFAGFQMADPGTKDYQPLCYESAGSLKQYEKFLGEKGVVVKSSHLWVFAPYKYAARAKALTEVLEEAHQLLSRIYGIQPLFKFSVEHYKKGNERGWGGISGAGTIGYPLESLQNFASLKKKDVRGFAGYTEEMSHGFKDYFRCGGTYEAMGVAVQEEMVRRMVSSRVADAFWGWRHKQCKETAEAYIKAGFKNPDPNKYPWNVLFTRILNHLFLELREEYGSELWTDFFTMIRQMDYPLHRAEKIDRMKVYKKLFTALFGRDMSKEFDKYRIDLNTDPPWGWETYKKKD